MNEYDYGEELAFFKRLEKFGQGKLLLKEIPDSEGQRLIEEGKLDPNAIFLNKSNIPQCLKNLVEFRPYLLELEPEPLE